MDRSFVHLSQNSIRIHSRSILRTADLSSVVGVAIWNEIGDSIPNGARPFYLLWAFLFLKAYSSEHVNSSLTGDDKKIS